MNGWEIWKRNDGNQCLAEYEQEMGERKESLALKLDKKVANAISKESHR